MAFTQGQFGNDGNGKTTQIDYIIAPNKTSGKAYIHNDVKTGYTRDIYPIYASIHEDDARNCFPQRRSAWVEDDWMMNSKVNSRRCGKLVLGQGAQLLSGSV